MSVVQLSTTLEQGFQFSITFTSPIDQITVRLVSFETVSLGRSVTLRIRNGAGVGGAILSTDSFTIANTSIPTDYVFVISTPPTLTGGNTYTATLTDTTAGGTGTGYVNLLGVPSSVNYITYNISTYPRLTASYFGGILFSQLVANLITSIVSTVTEQGFIIIPTVSGSMSQFDIALTSFESIALGRTLTVRIRNGAGVAGGIIYTNTYVIPNTPVLTDYSLTITPNVALVALSTYTITVVDTTVGGTTNGNVYVYGITPNGTFISYNIFVYPRLTIFLGSSITAFSQPSSPSVTDVISTAGYDGFRFVPTISGVLTGFSLNLTAFGTRVITFKIIQGAGLGGTLLYQDNATIPTISTRTDYRISLPPASAPILLRLNSYTLAVTDTSGAGGNVSLYGITPSVSYPVYGGITVYPRLFVYIPSYIITLNPPQNFAGFIGDNTDNIEFNTVVAENATTLYYNGLPNTRSTYYRISLQYIIIPNQILKTDYGGTFDRYPYIYVEIFNDGNPESLYVLTSNNPNSSKAVFKVPIDRYLYGIPTSFYTLKDEEKEQIIKFKPDQNIRIRILLPNGEIPQNKIDDNMSPVFPNPFLQVNALFGLSPVLDF